MMGNQYTTPNYLFLKSAENPFLEAEQSFMTYGQSCFSMSVVGAPAILSDVA